ncbi:unnamed protein product [Acanthosepion pharaonis]|uniref:DUF7041 domain-containing protein n=1 Tax=Acanthosepion pharaonis TaxID=158019 RepID=A0A812ATG3_ACAPH|nr:unnamed protein product [Sepia pharaonis]
MATDEWEKNTLINVAMPLTNLPPYNEQNTKNWFLQLEAIFSVRKITSQQAKFVNVVQVLPPSVVDEVADILEHGRQNTLTASTLHEEPTGETFHGRINLARTVDGQVTHYHNADIGAIADNTPLDQLANSADRIATKLDQGVCAVQRPDDTSAKETDLEKAVADLQHQLQDIRMLLSRTSRGPMPATGGWRRRARSTSRGRRVDRNYAGTITDSAPGQKNCSAPCKYSSKTKTTKLRSCATSTQGRTDYTTALSRRSSLSASADAPFTQVQTSRDRLDLGHPCFHSAYLQAVALKPDNAPPRLHDRTTTND